MFLWQGNFSQARECAGKILAMDPDDFNGLNLAGQTELCAGNYGLAKGYYEKLVAKGALSISGDITNSSLTNLGFILLRLNQRDPAQKMFERSLEIDKKLLDEGSEWWAVRYDMAAIHALRGNKAEAYRWLQKAVDAGWREYRWGLADPLFESMREEAKYKQIIAGLEKQVAEMRKRVELQ